MSRPVVAMIEAASSGLMPGIPSSRTMAGSAGASGPVPAPGQPAPGQPAPGQPAPGRSRPGHFHAARPVNNEKAYHELWLHKARKTGANWTTSRDKSI